MPADTLEHHCDLLPHYRGQGLRPRIIVEESGHPLSVQQRSGISLAEAWKIVHYYIDKKP